MALKDVGRAELTRFNNSEMGSRTKKLKYEEAKLDGLRVEIWSPV